MTSTITTTDLRQLLADDPDLRILDVRSGGEFETVHIPGSYNVPLETLHEHASDLADVSHPVVLVCQSGNRATKAHGTLTDAGKDRLHILDGGIVSWERAGGELVRGGERWAMDRQVRLAAGSLVVAGIAASFLVPKARFLSGFVGAGLTYSALTNTCAMATALAKLPYNRTDRCDIVGVLEEMQREPAAPLATAS